MAVSETMHTTHAQAARSALVGCLSRDPHSTNPPRNSHAERRAKRRSVSTPEPIFVPCFVHIPSLPISTSLPTHAQTHLPFAGRQNNMRRDTYFSSSPGPVQEVKDSIVWGTDRPESPGSRSSGTSGADDGDGGGFYNEYGRKNASHPPHQLPASDYRTRRVILDLANVVISLLPSWFAAFPFMQRIISGVVYTPP